MIICLRGECWKAEGLPQKKKKKKKARSREEKTKKVIF